jgi:HAD superfamily hydrolase (TIGR01490 family)
MAASYFDVDGTLVSTNLVHPTVFYMMRQPTPMHSLAKLGKALVRSPLLALAALQDRRLFNEMLFQSYEGTSEDRLLTLAEEAFRTVIKPNLFPGARDLVKACADRGHQVVIVSGALDFLMQLLADHLGAHGVIANKLEIKDRFATGKLMRPVVAGPEKAALVREHAKANGHDLEDCLLLGQLLDVPMLSIVGHPAVVNPDRKLRLLAAPITGHHPPRHLRHLGEPGLTTP